MKLRFTVLFMFFIGFLNAQTIVDFEEFPVDTFLNGSDGNGGFTTNGLFLPNAYNPQYGSWTGWAISSMTDTLSAGYLNQYSTIAGSGVEGSSNFAVGFGGTQIKVNNGEGSKQVNGLYVTNSTYPYLSIREGDGFAKKFGGVTGDEPDYFLLTIKAYAAGELLADSVDFYLADYRFEDNSQDYIIKEWTFVDLSSFGEVDSLSFSLSSTDIGQYGMNTPAYFCVDNIQLGDLVSSNDDLSITEMQVEVFPNPAVDYIQIKYEFNQVVQAAIFDMNGRLLKQKTLQNANERMNLQELAGGTYMLVVSGDGYRRSQLIVKQF